MNTQDLLASSLNLSFDEVELAIACTSPCERFHEIRELVSLPIFWLHL